MRTYYTGGGGQSSVEYTQAVSGGGVLHWSKSFIYAGGSVLATISPNGANEYVEYHHPDRLGTRLISNNQNVNVQEQESLPFGAALASGSGTRQFTSYDRSNATGLDYAVNRRYDSLQGRFTQVDPIGAGASSLTDPQSWNMYAYCGNDPVNHVDPDGLFFKKLFKWISKALKWIAVAITVAVFVLSIVVAPGSQGILATIFAKLTAGLTKLGTVLGKVGLGFLSKTAVGGNLLPLLKLTEAGALSLSAVGLGGIQAAGALGAIGNHAIQRSRSRRVKGDGKRKQPSYKTAQLAAVAILKATNPKSIKENREYGGAICQKADGTFIYTRPRKGGTSSVTIDPCPSGTADAGWYHTHAAHDPTLVSGGVDGNEIFSPGDMRISNGGRGPGWLATPTRRLYRYDPIGSGQFGGTSADLTGIYGRTP